MNEKDLKIIQESSPAQSIRDELVTLIAHLIKFKIVPEWRSGKWVSTIFNQSSLLSDYLNSGNDDNWDKVSSKENNLYKKIVEAFYDDNKTKLLRKAEYDIKIATSYQVIRNEFTNFKQFAEPERLRKYILSFLYNERPQDDSWIRYVQNYKN